MASVLTIDGTEVSRSDNSVRCILNRLTRSLDQPDSLEFAQLGATLPGAWMPGQSVALDDFDGVTTTPLFRGAIISRHPQKGPGGWTIGYRAMGLKYLANRIPITNPVDGTGTIVYNLPSTDDDYISTNSGLSVGTILTRLFDGHAAALAVFGITSYEAADLTPLTIVPVEPVVFQGSRLWNCVEDLLSQWYGQYAAYIDLDSSGNGKVRVVDTTAFSATAVTLDDDTNPWILDGVTEDISDCYTRVVVRGLADVEPAYVSLSESTLSEAFTSTDKANWTWYSFTQPGGAIDDGDITALTSTTVTVQSDDAAKTWAANYWSGIQAWIQLVNPAATDVTFSEWRLVTANDAHTAGTATAVTLDRALVNSGYTRYHLVGQPTGVSETWRLYDVVPTYVGGHLVKKFPRSVPWRPTSGAVVQTNYPAATICWSPDGSKPFLEFPATFEVLPATGQIRFSQPVVRTFGTLSNLEAGGASTDGIPDDIKVLLAYSRGAMTAVYPPDVAGVAQFSGPGHDLYSIEATLYRDYSEWSYAGDQASYEALAQQIHATVSAPVIEGTLRYEGRYDAGLILGMSVNITGNGYTTGYESISAPVRTVTLEWPQDSAGAPWVTQLQFSTRRRPYSGDKLYEHPMFAAGEQFAWEGLRIDPVAALGTVAAAAEAGPLGAMMGGANVDVE